MGGLLAAEAATDTTSTSRRIIGMIAFDTPYLGMHPHVVVSGIASLFPKDDDKDMKPSEKDMNEEHVKLVDDAVTDDWQNYKKNMDSTLSPSFRHAQYLTNCNQNRMDTSRQPLLRTAHHLHNLPHSSPTHR